MAEELKVLQRIEKLIEELVRLNSSGEWDKTKLKQDVDKIK